MTPLDTLESVNQIPNHKDEQEHQIRQRILLTDYVKYNYETEFPLSYDYVNNIPCTQHGTVTAWFNQMKENFKIPRISL